MQYHKNNYFMHKDIHVGLFPFIEIETLMGIKQLIILDIAQLNGENGDFLKGTEMDKYSLYESTARTVLRLMWFLDFVYFMLKGLDEDRNKSLGSVCSDAYSKALASNHPTHIVVAVKAGMYMVPKYFISKYI